MFGLKEKDLFEVRGNFINGVLEYGGIENPELFLNGKDHKEELNTDPFGLFNMDKAIIITKEVINDKLNSLIGILVDDDADGMTSSASLYKTLKDYGAKNIEFIFHEKKGHGLHGEVEKIIEGNYDLVFVPDSGSNDFNEQREVLESNTKLIIIDHHDMDNQVKILELCEEFEGKYALVNNQLIYNTVANKNLVGAGMVYKFAQALNLENSKNIIDLVSVGQVGDASDLTDYEIQMLVREGLENIQNGLLKEALANRISKGQKIAPINLSFDIIPFINAVTRVGTLNEKSELMLGLINYWDQDKLVEIEKRRKNKVTGKFEKRVEQWSPYAILLDKLTKIKARQNKEVDKVLKKINDPYLDGICIVEIEKDEIEYRSITGLIANKLVSKYNMPTLFLIKDEDGKLSGSARGYEKKFESFRKWCLKTEQFELAQGHDNAFGIVIEENKLSDLQAYMTHYDLNDGETIYEVNKIYEGESNLEEIKKINDFAWLFGGSLQSPKFGYKNLILTRNCISQRGSVVTFFDHGLEFIMYKQEPGLIDDFMAKMGFEQDVVVNLVGHASRNEWNGRVKEQIVLDDFSITPLSKTNLKKKEYVEKTWKEADEELEF